jgi:hypothetical protein
MLSFIKEGVQPDAVLWGGDSISHNLESITHEGVVEALKNVTRMVSDALEGIRVYPTIGNHDTYPMNSINMFDPSDNPVVNEWSPSWF